MTEVPAPAPSDVPWEFGVALGLPLIAVLAWFIVRFLTVREDRDP